MKLIIINIFSEYIAELRDIIPKVEIANLSSSATVDCSVLKLCPWNPANMVLSLSQKCPKILKYQIKNSFS